MNIANIYLRKRSTLVLPTAFIIGYQENMKPIIWLLLHVLVTKSQPNDNISDFYVYTLVNQLFGA